MLFQSTEFLLFFLPIVYTIFTLLKRGNQFPWAKRFLLTASLFFYAWWKPAYLPIFVCAILYTFFMAKALNHEKYTTYRRKIFWSGILGNLGLLFTFKYYDFFASSWTQMLPEAPQLPLAHFVLPLGISFFTFQNIAYIVDAYEGGPNATKLEDYAFYLAFFPHLLAGPIMHHKELLKQVEVPHPLRKEDFYGGLCLFLIGAVKKMAFADTFAMWANAGYSNAAALNLAEGWATVLTYTLQLYFDFSGYSDMAIGLGLLFGIRLPQNFNSPFKAKSIIEFWQRWHMTLTKFINFYVFMPIVRLFDSPRQPQILVATFIAMAIAGVWHGAGWNFLIFGVYHGLGLVINHLSRARKIKMPIALARIITSLFVILGFVFFRSPNMDVVKNIFLSLIGHGGIKLDPVLFKPVQVILSQLNATALGSWTQGLDIQFGAEWLARIGTLDRKLVLFCIFGYAVVNLCRNSQELSKQLQPSWRDALKIAVLLIIFANILYVNNHPSEFLYFNF
jgi:alginate O-acetyltransferase complex protein AlgI